MAVTKMVSPGKQDYLGISSGPWPGTPPEGSTFHMVDTGEEYIFFDGMWEQDLRNVGDPEFNKNA